MMHGLPAAALLVGGVVVVLGGVFLWSGDAGRRERALLLLRLLLGRRLDRRFDEVTTRDGATSCDPWSAEALRAGRCAPRAAADDD